jgi:hypothetical protein
MASHSGDGAAELCWQWRCRGHLAVARCRCRVMLVTVLSSHVGDGTATEGCTGHVKVA